MNFCNFINKAILHTSEVEIHSRPKLYHVSRYLVKAKLFCRKCFVPVTGLECSYGKILIPATEISGPPHTSPVNRADSVSEISARHYFPCKRYRWVHMRGWAVPLTEISVTGMKIFPYEHSTPVTERNFLTKIASLSHHSGQNGIILVLYIFLL